ncbi:MAG: formylglycine-generating enzyme family protein [Hyphomicrobiaceae bacterium]|nr:formylglycine-generating enzyme family protein [Hyphomicrobiaceae bacterium]
MILNDIIFWLLIALVAALAFAIESGLAARHKRVVLSSIFASILTAGYMMFMLEDNSSFDFEPPQQQEEKAKDRTVVAMEDGEGGGKKEKVKVVTIQGARGKKKKDGEELTPEAALMAQPGGHRECDACPLMTLVRGGKFIMGSPIGEIGRQGDEGPLTEIKLPKPFAVGRFEILRREYAAFVKGTNYKSTGYCIANKRLREDLNWQRPGFDQDDYHPAVCISWNDAKAYVAWLSQRTKQRYRLLTEAEWEYVARAGTRTSYWQGDEIKPKMARFAGDKPGTLRGGKFKENPFTLFDVNGNVWELVEDCYNSDLAVIREDGQAVSALTSCKHSIRGGAWDSAAPLLRSAARGQISPDAAYDNVGFRVARDVH